ERRRTGAHPALPLPLLYHAGLPHRLHLDGDGPVLRLPRHGGPDLRPADPAHLFRHGERRADQRAPLRVYGLHHRAGEHPGPAVPLAPDGLGQYPGQPGGGDAGHLRAVRHRHRHRGRCGDADGPARPAAHAAGRLRREARHRSDRRGRLLGHPDPALHHADPLRRDCWRLGGPALRGGLHPRHHAGEPLHSLRHGHRAGEAVGRAAAAAGRGAGPLRHPRPVPAHLLLPARGADRAGARCHPDGPRHAVRGGGHGLARLHHPRPRLPFLLLRQAAGKRVPHRAHQRHGVLAVRGLGHLLLGLRLPRRPGAGGGILQEPAAQQLHLHGLGAGADLRARLAAGVDRDHRDLRAHLPAVAGRLRRGPAVLRRDDRAEPANQLPVAPRSHGRLLPEGRGAEDGAAGTDLLRVHALYLHRRVLHAQRLRVPGHRHLAAGTALRRRRRRLAGAGGHPARGRVPRGRNDQV
ncbi:MAG: TRAP-type C4-dicarboxylate transport system, large permease component, partial [uncultured Acetobacteraceae bacterium]